jgi:hypothetical protein
LINHKTKYSALNPENITHNKIPIHPDNIVQICIFCIKLATAIMRHISGIIMPEDIATHKPQETARDLPPLNFKNGEKILPSKTKIDIITNSQESILKYFIAIKIGKNALDISSIIASKPSFNPPNFNTLVPPGLLSPTVLTSLFINKKPIIRDHGTLADKKDMDDQIKILIKTSKRRLN